MSMNKFMHPRNIYKTPPNFKELAINHPEFREYAQNKFDGSVSIDFKNPKAVRHLTTILLQKDFGLDVSIPRDNLVPTLPLRLNYILWLEDILELKPETNSITGIDIGTIIGTGATCIFPLLAAKINGWKMIGTEIDEISVNMALENVRKNSLDDLITVKRVCDSVFLDGVFDEEKTFDFCMCNPPFFSNEHDADSNQKSRTVNRKEPSNSRTGVSGEIISPGGEIEFIRNIIRDSLKLRERIKIYTTMMGHKSSLEILKKDLESHGLTYSQTMFCQGRTVRWALAWTFWSIPLQDHLPPTHKRTKPITWTFASKYNFKGCVELIPKLLTDLNIQFSLIESFKKRAMWKISAIENTWTGMRRKRRERRRMNMNENPTIEVEEESNMVTSSNLENFPDDTAASSIDQMEMDYSSLDRNAAKKRSLGEVDEDATFETKKLKQESILETLLSLHTGKNNAIDLQTTYISGLKEAPQQLMQYLKNNLA